MVRITTVRFISFIIVIGHWVSVSIVLAAEELERDSDEVIEEIVVQGVRGSIRRALDRKERAINVVDSIDAEDIGKFPDLNLAESLQRIPGVTLERSVTGSGRTLTVRGLSSQFSWVEINGMGGATGGGGRGGRIDTATRSAGQDGRNFNFDILPSELFTSAVFTKSPQASDTEGGIAAVVKLNTPSPFGLEEQVGTVSVQSNWGEVSDFSPRLSGLFSRQVSEQFAVLIGGVYSKYESDTSQIGFDRLVPYSAVAADPTLANPQQLAGLIPRGAAVIGRNRETENLSGIVTLQFRPSDTVDIRFDAMLANSEGDENENENFLDLTRGVPLPTMSTLSNEVFQSAMLPSFRRMQIQSRNDEIDDELTQFTLSAEIDLSESWRVAPFVGYNTREVSRRFDEINYLGSGGDLTYTLNNSVDDFSTSLTDFSSNPSAFVLSNVLAAQNDSESDESNMKLDVIGEFDFLNLKSLKFGVRYSDRAAEVNEPFRGALNFNPVGPTLDAVGTTRPVELGPSRIFALNTQGVASTVLGGQNVLNPNFEISMSQLGGIVIGDEDGDNLASAKVEEESTSFYVEGDWIFGNLGANFGIRYVQTKQTSSGFQSVDGVVMPITVDNDYNEVLPALNLRFQATDELVLRATYSMALSRPSLQALSPRETFNFNTLTGARGNPRLEPFVVNQYDIGFEWYFHEEALFGVTFFDKEFDSLIGQETVILNRNQASTIGGPMVQPVEFSQPLNTGDGSVDGFEITFQTRFFFLPEPISNAGLIFNYTDLDSEASIQTAAGTQAQPFPNLSPSSYNAALYFDNGTIDTRLFYTWREGFLQDGLDPNGNFFHQDDFGQLDLTMNYYFNDSLTLQLQATNLMDEELEFSSTARKISIRRIDTERRIIVGLKYDF